MIKGKLLVVSGPSGAGKSTICKRAVNNKNNYLSISATTRKPRDGEGCDDYIFLSENEFNEKIKNNEFLEYARVHGNYYGTLKKPVFDNLEKGNNVILEIDVQGSMQIKKIYHDCEMIFVLPPSLEVLISRLKGRKSETEEQFQLRLKNSVKEIKTAHEYDYLVINDNIDDAVEEINEIIKLLDKKIKYNMDFIDKFILEEESL
ncbi:MAG: guanylate kinase [Eubacteriaceae bacterium]|nr:guanylate kinase [Eubacteriaceae bacterium]